MKNYWKKIYLTLKSYNKKYKPNEKLIKEKYQKLRKELEENEKKELEELSKKINNEVNPDNLNIFENPYTLYYNLGKEIGFQIKLKFKPESETKYTKEWKYHEINENMIFTYECTDNREGIHEFVSECGKYKIFPANIIDCFEITVI